MNIANFNQPVTVILARNIEVYQKFSHFLKDQKFLYF